MRYVYILRSLKYTEKSYIGITADLQKRLTAHNSGRSFHTAKYRPWKIAHYEVFDSEKEAFKREQQLKKWSSAKKEALINGNIHQLKLLSRRTKS